MTKPEASDLSPEALEQRGRDLLVEGHKLLVRAEFARQQREEDYYSQTTSPLGRRRHNELARSGAIAATKYRGHWMIRKDDLHAYLRKAGKTVGRRETDEDVDDIIDRVMGTDEKVGRGR